MEERQRRLENTNHSLLLRIQVIRGAGLGLGRGQSLAGGRMLGWHTSDVPLKDEVAQLGREKYHTQPPGGRAASLFKESSYLPSDWLVGKYFNSALIYVNL